MTILSNTISMKTGCSVVGSFSTFHSVFKRDIKYKFTVNCQRVYIYTGKSGIDLCKTDKCQVSIKVTPVPKISHHSAT